MDSEDLIFKEEVFAVVGAAMEVSTILGHGLHEKPYENAIVVEFKNRKIPYHQQPRFPISYKDVKVGEYIPDIITHNSLVVDTKTIDRITDNEIGQMLTYLTITNLKVGLILNFKHAKLEWKRVIRSQT
jgi:GxxExxY protein